MAFLCTLAARMAPLSKIVSVRSPIPPALPATAEETMNCTTNRQSVSRREATAAAAVSDLPFLEDSLRPILKLLAGGSKQDRYA